MVMIILGKGKIGDGAWDYPIEELEYLLKEHDGETFVYSNGRLFEAESETTIFVEGA